MSTCQYCGCELRPGASKITSMKQMDIKTQKTSYAPTAVLCRNRKACKNRVKVQERQLSQLVAANEPEIVVEPIAA